jgi:ectoine hydroxylase-related dioxygenase (phytanoyl-CoA dioxygenase family)
MPTLERVPGDIAPQKLCALLERDGCAIVEGALTREQLRRLNTDLEAEIQAARPGVARPTHEFMKKFYGNTTIRIDGLPGKSPTFVEILCGPLIGAVADHFLLPSCIRYTLNTGQLIEILPGESAQFIHRDEDAWAQCPKPHPQLEIEALFALSDFTGANGGTQVVPGSHLWEAGRRAEPDEIVQAEMPAGSALFYLGSTLHGGGANATADERRRGMFLGFVVGWLRTEENTFLSTPIEAVKGMPRRAQELLGYEAHLGIGVVDVGSPMKLLE